jgi:hypothetical protein
MRGAVMHDYNELFPTEVSGEAEDANTSVSSTRMHLMRLHVDGCPQQYWERNSTERETATAYFNGNLEEVNYITLYIH